jgi:hypothetical protein
LRAVWKKSRIASHPAPEGFKVINKWVDVTGGRMFYLFEANNSDDILAWVYPWSDIMTFKVTPVMELEKVMDSI